MPDITLLPRIRANLWAIETCDNPHYPLELFQRFITVSVETMEICRSWTLIDATESIPNGVLANSSASLEAECHWRLLL